MVKCHLLAIDFEYNGQKQRIVPILLLDESERILIDCGYPDFIPLLEEAAGKHGVTLHSMTKLIATHHDLDHMGSLANLKRTYPQIEIVAHELEKPYVEGTSKSLRLEQAEATWDALPAEAKPAAEQFIRLLQSIEPAVVDRTVSDGEVLPWCGGIEIVHTPGHMPGHISLYLPSSKTLLAADAVVIEEGRLNLANPQYTLDLKEAIRSVERLLDYDIEQLICYHGGLYQGNVRQALLQVLERYKPKGSGGTPPSGRFL
ncbi:MBL fold hydrolase [Paenibacillus sp. J31TS4]|uniref:MBL fold metallo-hydrolase n=1 Tax=Paenibacillus sp. J31TS4 TaxID=2807195 RepID=UPI001B0BD93B|nr:MBL fold metallo-hydrolase [Paenibacillus sp. J31TS4]GIP37891.1 MBL fold hydrolase [Paenibacillus sp. J31TS4]